MELTIAQSSRPTSPSSASAEAAPSRSGAASRESAHGRRARDTISRGELLKRVLDSEAPAITVLQAPAGHGKTVLMRQLQASISRGRQVVAWLSLQERDNDSVHLNQRLRDALDCRQGHPSRLDRSRAGVSAAVVPNDPLSAGSPVPINLFLDDFHALTAPSVLAYFRETLASLPPRIRIFISSRGEIDINMSRLLVSGRAQVIRAKQLRFSPSEVRRFFRKGRICRMSREAVAAIHKNTAGWPAALQLYRLSFMADQGRAPRPEELASRRPADLTDYLGQNVLHSQSAEVQRFLLQTSILPKLSAPLCDAVLECFGSEDILLRLERAGLFLEELNSEPGWYRYHSIFSSFLLNRLYADSSEQIPVLHRRAMHWCEARGYHELAMHHAMAIPDPKSAARVFRKWAERLLLDGNLTTIEKWCELLPLPNLVEDINLLKIVAYCYAYKRKKHKFEEIAGHMGLPESLSGDEPRGAETAVIRAVISVINDDLELAEQISGNIEVGPSNQQGFQAFELTTAAVMKGHLATVRGDFEGARNYLLLARGHGERMGVPFSLGCALATAAVIELAQGNPRAAMEKVHGLIPAKSPRLVQSAGTAKGVAVYVHALYEINDLDQAIETFESCKDLIKEYAFLDYLGSAYLFAARALYERGEPGAACELLDEAEAIAYGAEWPRLIRDVQWERVRYALLNGDIRLASQVAAELANGDVGEKGLLLEDVEGREVGHIRLALHSGDARRALKLLAPALAAAKQQNRSRRMVKLLVLQACARRALGEPDRAASTLQAALGLAVRGPLVRTIVDEGELVASLLREEYERAFSLNVEHGPNFVGTSRRFLWTLLEACGNPPDLSTCASHAHCESSPELTEKERKILSALASGASNKEIAGRTFISLNTVKYHLKNIFRKVGAENRLQATSIARGMDLSTKGDDDY